VGFSKSPLAFGDVREAFDRALNSPKGIRIPCETRGAAIVLRSRFNYFRKIDRDESKRVYPIDHGMYNCSAYDKLILRVPAKGAPDETVLYIEPRLSTDMQIEEIE